MNIISNIGYIFYMEFRNKTTKLYIYTSTAIDCIIIVQRWYRCYLKRQTTRKACIWTCWVNIVYRNELKLKEVILNSLSYY